MYCVMHMEKRKRQDIAGIEKEVTRTANSYNNNVMVGMDMYNITLVDSNNWIQSINDEIKRAGAKTRSNSVVALDTVYTASREFFKTTKYDRTDYFEDCLKFHEKRFGHVISATIHYDETTPHMHIISVPLTTDNRLSAKEIVGNRTTMITMQDDFYEQVGKRYNLERGVHLDGNEKREHISAQEYELRKTKSELDNAKVELDNIKNARVRVREQIKWLKDDADELNSQNTFLRAIKNNLQKDLDMQRSKLNEMTNDVKSLESFLDNAQKRQFSEIKKKHHVYTYDDYDDMER